MSTPAISPTAPAPGRSAGARSRRGAEALPACPPALRPWAEQSRWVVWRYGSARKGAKPPKVPYDPRTGEPANTTDPADWGTLAEALAAARRGHWRTSQDGRGYRQRYDGVGIILGDGLIGVDFDHCIDAVGQLAPAVAADVADLSSYTEVSPSGTGVKVLVQGTLPRSWKADYCEAYDSDRFFALTFRQLDGTPDGIRPAQAALDALAARWAPARRSGTDETPRALGAPRPSRHALGTPAFWAEVRYWERHQSRLLRPDGLPYAMSPQLRALVERGELPAALAAKGDSPSERRACVVAQLRRAGYAYGDAEAYVVARALWRRLGVDTKRERDLIGDALYLVLMEYPATAAQLHPASQARARDYARDRAVGCVDDATVPEAWASAPTAARRRAPADPAAYLTALEEAAVCGVVMLTLAERAVLIDIHPKTAQRIEKELEAQGLIARTKPVRTATGRAVYVQILNRINVLFSAPGGLAREDVQTPPADSIRTPEEPRGEPQAIGQDTVCPVAAPAAPAVAAPPLGTPPPTCPVLPPPPAPLTPRALVAEALDACDAAHGRAKFRAVVAYVRANGGSSLPEAAIRRLYDAERARRRYAKQDAALAERASSWSSARRRREMERRARRMADEPRAALVWGHQHRVIAEVHAARLAAELAPAAVPAQQIPLVLADLAPTALLVPVSAPWAVAASDVLPDRAVEPAARYQAAHEAAVAAALGRGKSTLQLYLEARAGPVGCAD